MFKKWISILSLRKIIPLIIIDMKPGVDFVGIAVSSYCHDGQGNFVLQQRSQNCRDECGTWTAGGGVLEFGESPEEALKREVKEEYGCEGIVEEALPPKTFISDQDGVKRHWIILRFFVKVDPKEVRLNEPESMSDIGWFRVGNLPSPLHSGAKVDFDTLKEYFARYS